MTGQSQIHSLAYTSCSIRFCTRLLDTGLDCVASVVLHAHALMLYDIDLCYRLYVLYSMFTLCVDVTFTVKGDAIQYHNIISIHDTSRPLRGGLYLHNSINRILFFV